jgi:hypothetical protein
MPQPQLQKLKDTIDDYINLKPIVDEYLDLNIPNASEKHMLQILNIAIKEYFLTFSK